MTQPPYIVMGILNVTEDSFSDGGRFLSIDRAIEHGLTLVQQGASIIDVGGQSTRPGFQAIDPNIERERIIPVIHQLNTHQITISVDTTNADVARAAIQAGARIINDVSAGQADPRMASLVAETNVRWILMHWRPTSSGQHSHQISNYHNVVQEVRDELRYFIDQALLAGVDPSSIIVDPGIGFGKASHHNWALLRDLSLLIHDGFPVLIGVSRKRFLGTLLTNSSNQIPSPEYRDLATAVISALAVFQGVWGVRVHNVQASVDALKVVHAWKGTTYA